MARRFSGIALLTLVVLFAQPVFAQRQAAESGQEPAKSAGADSNSNTAKEPAPTSEKKGDEAKKESQDSTKSDASSKPDISSNTKAKKSNPDKSKSTAKASTKPAPKKQIRLIALSGIYQDFLEPLQLDAGTLLLGGDFVKPKSFFRLCEYLDELSKEELVTHVVFDLSDLVLAMNSAQLDELARRMEKLKGAGKKTIAWVENASNVQLAIATTCDKIVMADFGGIDMPSTAMESMFYRDAMDLVGVKASVVRAGDFKGAVEPFMNPMMSEHLREHYRDMLKSINDAQVSRIAKGRGMTSAAVRELQQQRMLLPKEALAKGLVDHLAPYGSMKATISKLTDAELEWTTPKAKPKREMNFFDLMGNIMAGPRRSSSRIREDSIVVLHLSGAIVDGKRASPGSIVSGPTVKAIDELTKDEKVKAVVVRVNSPGGSATASEAVRMALESLAKAKPVVFSMGEMAASGGYWVTCIGQPIYAEKGTITGSIGVFAMKLSLGSLLRRVGIHVESVALDESAAADAIDREWNESDSKNLQRFIDEVYDRFLELAGTSRKIPVEKLKSLAGGRVWTGEQAKQNGLIDELGGLDDSLVAAAKRAKLENYKVVHRPEPSSGLSLFELLGEDDESDISLAGMSGNLLGMGSGLAAGLANSGNFRFAQQLNQEGIQLLRERGFKLTSIDLMIRDSLLPRRGRTTVWALVPLEMSFR